MKEPCIHKRRFAACPDCDARWDLKGTHWVTPLEENDRLRAENAKLKSALIAARKTLLHDSSLYACPLTIKKIDDALAIGPTPPPEKDEP